MVINVIEAKYEVEEEVEEPEELDANDVEVITEKHKE
jgi:hypothetical protein